MEKKDTEAVVTDKQQETPEITSQATTALAIIHETDEEKTIGEEVIEKAVEKEVETSGEKVVEKEAGEKSEEAMELGNYQMAMSGTEEGEKWQNVSPSKQGHPMARSPKETSIISSPSRFAVLHEQDDSGNGTQDAEEDSEEGEILDSQSHAEESNQDRVEKQKTEIGNGANTRRVSTRHSKSTAKATAEVKSQSTSNYASTAGRKRGTKNI